ncbi:alkB-like protein 6 [Rhinolophus ferrumequinum]|uniref:AlkB-like protein 6 n=1 Tax=Rhinolophus ferrumequinum TaxID=59479 RepID=A0A7J7SGF9_RHIFE|nr:alkB-like protein 6 [Rhinolophus ferrumequinum]
MGLMAAGRKLLGWGLKLRYLKGLGYDPGRTGCKRLERTNMCSLIGLWWMEFGSSMPQSQSGPSSPGGSYRTGPWPWYPWIFIPTLMSLGARLPLSLCLWGLADPRPLDSQSLLISRPS